MSEKSRKLWQIVMLLAINLFVLITVSSAFHANAVCLGSNGEKVAEVQKALKKIGLYGGEISGEYDFATRKSVKNFQKSHGIADSGEADYTTFSALGLGARSGECFSVQTELLARYLKTNGGARYPAMLETAEEILEKSGSLPLCQYLFNTDSDFYKYIIDTEPSSESYSAALQAMRMRSYKK